jgi:hypothetical protein
LASFLMALTAGGTGVPAEAVEGGVGVPLWAALVIGEGMGATFAVDVGDGAGEPVAPGSIAPDGAKGAVAVEAGGGIEDPPWPGDPAAGRGDGVGGFEATSDALGAGIGVVVGEDGAPAAEPGWDIGKPA